MDSGKEVKEKQAKVDKLEAKLAELTADIYRTKQQKMTAQANLQLKNSVEEAKKPVENELTGQIEEAIKQAIANGTVSKLYRIPLTLINQLNDGSSKQLQLLAEHIAASKVQAVKRRMASQQEYKILKFQKKTVANRIGKFWKWRLQRFRDVADQGQKDLQRRKEEAARKIYHAWKASKARKGQAMTITQAVFVLQAKETTSGFVEIQEQQQCHKCQEKLAKRYCEQCSQDLKLFCIDCFKSYHSKGKRRTHEKKKILYEEDLLAAKKQKTLQQNQKQADAGADGRESDDE